MCDLFVDKFYCFYFKFFIIKLIIVSLIFFFNKQRNGCCFYCDVLIGEIKIYLICIDFE